MFITYRRWFKYGNEEDEVEVTTKYHETFEKAHSYAKRYATGRKFVGCSIEDENGNLLYDIFDYGAKEEDYREKGIEEIEEIAISEDNKASATGKIPFYKPIYKNKKEENILSNNQYKSDYG